MISKHYIDRAVKIRKEYLSLNVNLSSQLDKIKDFRDAISKLVSELNDIDKVLSKDGYSTEEEARKEVFSKIAVLERESKIMESVYKPVNDRMEELVKEEEILYNNIKEKYPELSDKQIVDEIKKYITE